MLKYLLIILFSVIIIFLIYNQFFKIDRSRRISKTEGLWPNKPLYDIYKKHNQIEENLNPNIDYSLRISKTWGLWSNKPLYDIYKKHNQIEENLNPNMDRLIADSNNASSYLDPELLDLYNRAPIPVMKSDILRLGMIYQRGGWYCDMDVKPSIPWKEFMKNYDVILFAEDDVKKNWPCPKENRSMTLRIAYDIFYAKAKDDFIKHVINTLKFRCREEGFYKSTISCDILYYTGPDMFTTAYYTYPKKERLYVYSENEYKDKLNLGKKGDYWN